MLFFVSVATVDFFYLSLTAVVVVGVTTYDSIIVAASNYLCVAVVTVLSL